MKRAGHLVVGGRRTRERLVRTSSRQEHVDAEKILAELREKAARVPWHNEERKEHYIVFAKSFKTKAKGALLFDREGIGRLGRLGSGAGDPR